MPKTFLKRSGGWTEMKSIFVKKSTGWTEVRSVFVKRVVSNVATWVRVYFKSALPDTTTPPEIRTTSSTSDIYAGPAAVSPRYLNDNLFGKDGEYTNFTSKFGRKFTRGSTSTATTRTTIVDDDRFTTAGGVTTAMRTACDEQFLFYELTVQNISSANEIQSISSPVKMIKQEPSVDVNTTGWTGTEQVGTELSFNYTLENYYYNRIEPASSYIRWWRSTTTSPGGTKVKEETITDTTTGTPSTSSRSGTSKYTPQADDVGYYIVAEIIAVSSNTRHRGFTDNYSVFSFPTADTIKDKYRFAFGNTLYVSSNGHIGLESGSSSYTSMSSGKNISIFVKDFEQVYLARYSDSSSYYLYFKSYLLNSGTESPANALDYQIRFYNDPLINYCDVRIIRKGSNVGLESDIDTGYYSAGTDGYAGMLGPYVIGTGSVFRVYFGGLAGTTSGISWTSVNDNLWDVIQTWPYPNGVDDTFTAVVTAANQRNVFPENTAGFEPTLSTDTGNFSAGSTITINPGTWTNTSSFGYELLYSSLTPISASSTSTKTLVNTNQYVITNADANAPSYYFKGRITAYEGAGQTGDSTIATTITSDRSTLRPTSTIAVGTATATGFTVSGTAGPLTGFGGSYASVSEIQIYNSVQTLISTITTGLPVVDGTAGTWSYIWTGGSTSTTYYAKAKIKASDSDQTTFTTAFSDSITTTAGTTTPTALSADVSTGSIVLTFSGGSGTQYDIFYANQAGSRPTDGQAFADFPDKTSPYTADTLTSRDITRYFWVRKSSGTVRSNWFPAGEGVTARLPLFAPPVPNTPTSSGITATNITVSWTSGTAATGTDAGTSFEVYTSTDSTAPTAATAGTTETSPKNYTYTASSSPAKRYFWVRAVNKDAKSAYSAVLEATPTARYTITYNGNTNTGGSTTATTGNGNVTLAANGFTKTNFTFSQWNTKADGTGTGYAAGATFNLTADVDLYAIWTAVVVVQYTVTWNANGGTGGTSTTQDAGTSHQSPTVTRTGFTLSGWRNPQTGGDPTIVSAGGTFTPTANITFWAQWTPLPTTTATGVRNYNSFGVNITLPTGTGSVVIVWGSSTSYGSTMGTYTDAGTKSPVGPLLPNTTYYFRATPWSGTSGNGTQGTAVTGSVTTYATPANTSTKPATPIFQRVTATTANPNTGYIRWGWNNNSALTPTGDYASWGFQFRVYNEIGLSTTYATVIKNFQDTSFDTRLINTNQRRYVASGEQSATGFTGEFNFSSTSKYGRYRTWYIPHGDTARVFSDVWSDAI
jgi:hypothetical protein